MKRALTMVVFALILTAAFSGKTFGAYSEKRAMFGSVWILLEERIGNFWKEMTQALFIPERKQKGGEKESGIDANNQVNEVEKINLVIPFAEPLPSKRVLTPPAVSPIPSPVILTQKKAPCQFFKTPLACLFPKKTETKEDDSQPTNGNVNQNITPKQDSLTNNTPTTASSSAYSPPSPAETPAPTPTKTVSAPPAKNPSTTDADTVVNSILEGLEDEEGVTNSEADEDDSDIISSDEIENFFNESDFE